MDMIGSDKPILVSAYPGPAPPSASAIHGPSPVHAAAAYEPAWRSYPPPMGTTTPTAPLRRPSSNTQPALPSLTYPAFSNRELPELPHDASSYARANAGGPSPTQIGPSPTPIGPSSTHVSPQLQTSHPTSHPRLMNGSSLSHPPQSDPPAYGPRLSFAPPPQESSHLNGDVPPPPAQYVHPVPHLPQTPGAYDQSYYSHPSFSMRQRRATRAQQACDQCRARKAKCDEGRPMCSHCKENNLFCVYKEVPPHKQEKATQAIVDRFQQVDNRMDNLYDRMEDRFSQMRNNVNNLQDLVEERFSKICSELTQIGQLLAQVPSSNPVSQVPPKRPVLVTPARVESREASLSRETQVPAAAAGEAIEVPVEDEENKDEGGLSIPIDHTTAAHKLLRWPSIKNLLYPSECDEDYVMQLEKNRRLICPYGRGEGDDTAEFPAAVPVTEQSTPTLEDSKSFANSSFSGTKTGLEGGSRAGITDSGVLVTDAQTVRSQYESYLCHIHKLHPFLDQFELERNVERFIESYCPSYTPPGEVPRGAKRKRSDDSTLEFKIDDLASGGPRRVEKSIQNAVILMVLALGAICDWRSLPLPGPVSKHPLDIQSEQVQGSAITSPNVTSNGLFAYPMTSGQRSFSNHSNMSESYITRNVDVFPGLAYFAYGTGILGLLHSADGLPHVQAALLAGLYTGQLARPFESHDWIYKAAKSCQVLIRPKDFEALKSQEGALKDLHGFAFWTCLQLESDILAELDLPASGISRLEGRMDLPSGRYTLNLPNEISAPNTMMMVFYSAQVHLRKVLNRVHTDLYKAEKEGHTNWPPSVQETLSTNLDMWRGNLPEMMKWKDNDPPSSDINVARMRAKYYGARYIIYRPLLHHALHLPSQRQGQSNGNGPTPKKPLIAHGTIWPGPTWPDLPAKLRRACTVCISSAIASTTAFDGIRGRPVVTNIFGTAHAQFGNMLVLAATYMSNMSELVDRDLLEQLLKRTMRFLLQSRYISPSLRADARILSEVYFKIYGEPPVLGEDGPGSNTGQVLMNFSS